MVSSHPEIAPKKSRQKNRAQKVAPAKSRPAADRRYRANRRSGGH